ncbi:hypothetical protein [Nitratidesulfovibrio sp. 1201_IL3209]
MLSEDELILYTTDDGATDEEDIAQLEAMEKAAKGRKKEGGNA